MAWNRVNRVEDVVAVGDEVRVVVSEIDDQGRLNLSMRDLMEKPEGYVERTDDDGGRSGRSGGRSFRGDRRGDRSDRSRGDRSRGDRDGRSRDRGGRDSRRSVDRGRDDDDREPRGERYF